MLISRPWAWGAGALGLLVGAFFAGRYSCPTRVEERVRVQLVDHQVVAIQERVRVETVTVEKVTHQLKVVEHETRRPDGALEKTRTEESLVSSDVRSTAETDKDATAVAHRDREVSARSSVVASYAPRWRVGATVGVMPFETWRPIYGGEAGVRVVGPFWASLSVRSDGSASAGVAFEF